MSAIDQGRFTVAAGAVGLAQACLDASLAYAHERETFGEEIGRHQLVKQMIANMAEGTEIGRLLVWRAAWLKNHGVRNTRETSLAKWHATEHAVAAALDAIQVHGANGYSNEFPVERYLRNSKAAVIYEGTSQLHTLIQADYALGYREDRPLRCEPLAGPGLRAARPCLRPPGGDRSRPRPGRRHRADALVGGRAGYPGRGRRDVRPGRRNPSGQPGRGSPRPGRRSGTGRRPADGLAPARAARGQPRPGRGIEAVPRPLAGGAREIPPGLGQLPLRAAPDGLPGASQAALLPGLRRSRRDRDVAIRTGPESATGRTSRN